MLQAATSEAKAASKKLGVSSAHASKSTTDLAYELEDGLAYCLPFLCEKNQKNEKLEDENAFQHVSNSRWD